MHHDRWRADDQLTVAPHWEAIGVAGSRQQEYDPGLVEDPGFRRAEDLIARARRGAIEMLDELVAIPTVNPPGNLYHECALLLAERLRELDIEPRLIDVAPHDLIRLGLPHLPHFGRPHPPRVREVCGYQERPRAPEPNRRADQDTSARRHRFRTSQAHRPC